MTSTRKRSERDPTALYVKPGTRLDLKGKGSVKWQRGQTRNDMRKHWIVGSCWLKESYVLHCMASVALNFQPFYHPTVFPASLHLSGHQSHARHQDNQQGGFEKCEAQIETRGAINKVIQVKKLMFWHGLIDSWSQYLLFLLIIIQQSSSSRAASLSTGSSFSSSSASSTYLPSLLWASTTSWPLGVKSKACLHLCGCFIDSADRLTRSNWDPIVSNRPLRSRSLQEGWLVQASRCIMHTAYCILSWDQLWSKSLWMFGVCFVDTITLRRRFRSWRSWTIQTFASSTSPSKIIETCIAMHWTMKVLSSPATIC